MDSYPKIIKKCAGSLDLSYNDYRKRETVGRRTADPLLPEFETPVG